MTSFDPKLMLPLLVIALLVGCSGADEESKASHSELMAKTMTGMYNPGPSDRFDNEDNPIQPFDLNGDQAADLWKIFLVVEHKDEEDTSLRLIRKEVDTNFDEKVDLWFHYNSTEQLFLEEADSNFDGAVDLVSYYESGRLVKRETFLPEQSTPAAIKSYKEGRLYKVELDENHDGLIERWEIYADGRLLQIGRDVNGDGKVDYWDNFAE